MRRYFAPVLTVLLLFCAGCGAPSSQTVSPEAEQPTTAAESAPAMESTPESSAGPQPWTEVTDGNWDHGDAALGQPIEASFGEYSITVTAPPTLTTSTQGATVTMTSPITVDRLSDRGFGRNLSDDIDVFFTPGNLDYLVHSETYGTYTKFACDPEVLPVGQRAVCTVSFTAKSDEIQDSHWDIAGKIAAAWPSQTP